MNGRAPEYKKVNPVTLIDPKTNKFKTFHKNAHEQLMITDGRFWGCTYEIGESVYPDRENGNAEYKKLRKNGWIKWQDFCNEKNLYIGDYGYYLF